jgi:hypothetical protein
MFLLRLIRKPAGQFYQSNLSTDNARSQCSQSSLRTPSVESFGNPLQTSTLDIHIHLDAMRAHSGTEGGGGGAMEKHQSYH